MSDFVFAMVLATLAGLSVPFGASLNFLVRRVPVMQSEVFRHSVVAFGAGALMSAVALVLVPEGSELLPGWLAVALFVAGGVLFFILDRMLARSGSHAAQFLAMMLDYVPEAMALGALLTGATDIAILMAVLIALQNVPEGFNAFAEMQSGALSSMWLFLLFVLMVPIGPLAAALGMGVLVTHSALLGAVMMISSGGILYLIFQDIGPLAHSVGSRVPPLWAVAGFALGLAGHLMTG